MSSSSCFLPKEPPRALLSYVHPGMYSVADKKGSTIVLDSQHAPALGNRDRENYRKAYLFAQKFFEDNGNWDRWNPQIFRKFSEGLNRELLQFNESHYRHDGEEITYVQKKADAPLVLFEPNNFIDYLDRIGDHDSIPHFIKFYSDKNLGKSFAEEIQRSDAMDPISASKVLPPKIKEVLKKYIRLCPANSTVPARMDRLFRDFIKSLQEKDPIKSAALLHTGFVAIHPFSDGNGRQARMLMNFVLLQHKLPPLFFPSDREYDKEVTRAVEPQTKEGGPESFARFLGREVEKLKKTLAEKPPIGAEDSYDPNAYAEHLPLLPNIQRIGENPNVQNGLQVVYADLLKKGQKMKSIDDRKEGE